MSTIKDTARSLLQCVALHHSHIHWSNLPFTSTTKGAARNVLQCIAVCCSASRAPNLHLASTLIGTTCSLCETAINIITNEMCCFVSRTHVCQSILHITSIITGTTHSLCETPDQFYHERNAGSLWYDYRRQLCRCNWCVLQCVAVCCSVLQCDAVCCSAVRCGAAWCSNDARCLFNTTTAVNYAAAFSVCCSVLQCVAVFGSVVQRVAVCCSVCCSDDVIPLIPEPSPAYNLCHVPGTAANSTW